MFDKIKTILFSILAVLLLSACAPTQTESVIKPIETIPVQITTSLTNWIPRLNTCAEPLTDANLLINILPPEDLDPQSADLIIRFGPKTPDDDFLTVLAYGNLVFIVHPDFPLDEISAQSLYALFNGSIKNWSQLEEIQSGDIEYDLPLNLFSYGENNDLHKLLSKALMENNLVTKKAIYTPSFENMLQSIAQTPGSLGYLLKSQLNNHVNGLKITNPNELSISLEQPILAIANETPTGSLRQLLLCLQNTQ